MNKKQCPKCLGFGVCTKEGRVFVQPIPPICDMCNGIGEIEVQNEQEAEGKT